jgi:RNA polymerase primary sigma factor
MNGTNIPQTHERSLDTYFHEINRFALLTREQESDCAVKIRAGDNDALELLVQSNLRFVVTVAKKYMYHGLSLSDLINEGNLGLIKAAHRFDEKRGFKFISYAVWWVKQSILQALLDCGRMIRLPQNQTAVLLKVNRARNKLESSGVDSPNMEQLAEYSGVDIGHVKIAMKLGGHIIHLDDTGSEDDGMPMLETISNDNDDPTDQEVMDRVLKEDIASSLDCLTPREKSIMISYYGLGHDEAMTLETIGGTLGLTRERIRQIKEKSLEKMRMQAGISALVDYS